jgi:hypothetical protein
MTSAITIDWGKKTQTYISDKTGFSQGIIKPKATT